LIFLLILIVLNTDNETIKIFKESFVSDNFSLFAKLLILISSFFILIISKKYIVDIKNNKFEYEDICRLLKEFHGKCPVMIEYHSNNASGNIPLKSEYDVSLHRDLLDALDENFGQGKYKIQY